MAVYNRQMTTVCAASNNSIISIYDLGASELIQPINITALHLAVGWLLNYTASGLPAESSINFWFWFAPSGTYTSLWEANAYTTLQSLLAFILWEFCTNNNQNPAVVPEENGELPYLPAAFQTTASISQPYPKFVLNRVAFIIYLILESLALILCWSVIVWQCMSCRHHPEISSYPLVDFASKLQEKPALDGGSAPSLRSVISAASDDKAIRHSLTKMKMIVVCNNTTDGPGTAALMDSNDDHRLEEGPLRNPSHSIDHSLTQSQNVSSVGGGGESESHLDNKPSSEIRRSLSEASSDSANHNIPDNQSSCEPNHDTSALVVDPTNSDVSPDSFATAASNHTVQP